jgi:phosphoglycolate phosphatase
VTWRAAIFDLDGTILDTIDDLADSMNSVLLRRGFPGHGVEAYKYFVGDGIELLVERALPEARRDPALVAACTDEMRREYGRRWNVKTRPYDGMQELLRALSNLGVKLAVLSNKPHDATVEVVKALLPDAGFDIVRGALPRVPRKPDPAAALAIAAELGARPDECLYVGDTAVDMKTAAAAGMKAVGVLWGFRDRTELVESGADFIVGRPAEILELVRKGK